MTTLKGMKALTGAFAPPTEEIWSFFLPGRSEVENEVENPCRQLSKSGSLPRAFYMREMNSNLRSPKEAGFKPAVFLLMESLLLAKGAGGRSAVSKKRASLFAS
jgi:hypothetical protein